MLKTMPPAQPPPARPNSTATETGPAAWFVTTIPAARAAPAAAAGPKSAPCRGVHSDRGSIVTAGTAGAGSRLEGAGDTTVTSGSGPSGVVPVEIGFMPD